MFTPSPPPPPPSLSPHTSPYFLLTPTLIPHSENVTFEQAAGTYFPEVDNWFTIVLYIFGAFHLFFSLWMLVEYFLINWKNFVLPQYFYYPIARYVCVCVCMCVFCLLYMCMLLTCYAFRCQFSWHEPPEETYSDVNIFGLQTMYVVVSTCTSE